MRDRQWHGAAWLLIAMVLSALGTPAAAAEEVGYPIPAPTATSARPVASAKADAAPHPAFQSNRNITDALRETRQNRASVFNLGIRDFAVRIDDLVYDATRIRFAATYTALYQHANKGNGPRDAAGADFDLIGTWDAVMSGDRATGALEAAFEGRYAYGSEIPPAALSRTIDSLWPTTSGFNDQDFSLIQVYWRQDLLNDRLHYRIGKLSGYSTFFGNRINSSTLFFLNYAFADNPAVFIPGNGLGIHATWDFSPTWSLSAGVQNANGVKTKIEPSTLRYGEFWYALQLQARFQIPRLGNGTYRVGAWYVTAREVVDTSPGAGTALSIDQELGEKLISFLRYEAQGEGLVNPEVRFNALTGTLSALRGGLLVKGPFKPLPNDLLGVGLAWGVPSGSRAKDSYVAEIFYRLQVESANQLSFSLQLIRSSTIFDQVFVGSVRYRIEF